MTVDDAYCWTAILSAAAMAGGFYAAPGNARITDPCQQPFQWKAIIENAAELAGLLGDRLFADARGQTVRDLMMARQEVERLKQIIATKREVKFQPQNRMGPDPDPGPGTVTVFFFEYDDWWYGLILTTGVTGPKLEVFGGGGFRTGQQLCDLLEGHLTQRAQRLGAPAPRLVWERLISPRYSGPTA